MRAIKKTAGYAFAAGAALVLQGCISFAADPPDQLFTLTAASTVAAGTASTGDANSALSVMPLEAAQRLNVTRIPVQVNEASVAYLQDAFWVEKPTELFQRLLAETIRGKGTRLVVNGSDAQYAAATKLSGHLLEMGYDASTSSAVVSFEAVLQSPEGQIRTRRFTESVPGIVAEAGAVGAALNQASNRVADQVAEWVG